MDEGGGSTVVNIDVSGIIDAINQGTQVQQQILDKLGCIDFYMGILVGVLLGLIFWNVAKGMVNNA